MQKIRHISQKITEILRLCFKFIQKFCFWYLGKVKKFQNCMYTHLKVRTISEQCVSKLPLPMPWIGLNNIRYLYSQHFPTVFDNCQYVAAIACTFWLYWIFCWELQGSLCLLRTMVALVRCTHTLAQFIGAFHHLFMLLFQILVVWVAHIISHIQSHLG